MKKLMFFTVLLLLSLVVVSPVLAGGKWVNSQKASFYKVYGCSSNVVSDDLSGGQVILVDPMGNVSMVVQGNVRGLNPLAKYDVWIRNLTGYTGPYITEYAPLGYFKLATITTDDEGNGSFHFNLRTDELPDGNYEIQVAINPYNNQGCTVVATQWPGIFISVKSE